MAEQPAMVKSKQPDPPVRAETAAIKPANIPSQPAGKPARTKGLGSVEMPVVTALVVAGLFYGWLQSGEGHITAETGIGYALGIVGSVLMLLLLFYPLRKRLKFLRAIGSVRAWFRIHMLLGVIGPALVVLHSNFVLGSLNSSVALWAMLVVATSGFAGRFFYARMHRGLYGRKHNAEELARNVLEIRNSISMNNYTMAEIEAEISKYENVRPDQAPGFWRVLFSGFGDRFRREKLKQRLDRLLSDRLQASGMSPNVRRQQLADFDASLGQYFRAVARAKTFEIYERLFSVWHMLHMPLFFVLVLAALVHVLAVHLY